MVGVEWVADWTYTIDESWIVALCHYVAEVFSVYGADSRYGGTRGTIYYILKFLCGVILRILLLGWFPLDFNVHATSSLCVLPFLFSFFLSLVLFAAKGPVRSINS